jgi:hypothetical protein
MAGDACAGRVDGAGPLSRERADRALELYSRALDVCKELCGPQSIHTVALVEKISAFRERVSQWEGRMLASSTAQSRLEAPEKSNQAREEVRLKRPFDTE